MRKINSIIIIIMLCLSTSVMVFASNDAIEKSKEKLKEKSIEKLEEKSIEKLKKIKKDKKFVVVSDDGKGNYSFVPSDDVKDKEAYGAEVDGVMAQGTYWTTCSPTNYGIDVYNGDYCYNKFSSDIFVDQNCNGWGDYKLSVSGTSNCAWLGYSPFYADSINDADSFSFSTIGLSVSISYPPGIGVGQGSSSCSLQYPAIHHWRYDHSYNGISCQAWCIYGYQQSKCSIFSFGHITASPNCSQSITIW